MAELPGGGRRGEEEQQVREADQGVGAGAAAAMDEQIVVRMPPTLFRRRACLPVKPLTFQCEAGHAVSVRGTCRAWHGQAFTEHGCASSVVYSQTSDHARCYCPEPSCHAFASPPRLLDHFRAAHPSWPVTEVSYGESRKLTLLPPAPRGLHALVVGKEDRAVFLVSSSALGPATAVSVVCVRANGDAAVAAQFFCTLWVDGPRGSGGKLTWRRAATCPAAEQGLLLEVPPEMAHDESGEAPGLMVRIDKALSYIYTPTPVARSSGSRPPATA